MHWISFLALWCHATDVTVRPNHSTTFKLVTTMGVCYGFLHLILQMQLPACCLLQKLPDLPCAEDLVSCPQRRSGIGAVSCFHFALRHLSSSPCILAV